ncbi:MFS transporter [Amycolatopsis jejuensis]|uniref:MFS transporter n=1 Tax=Amycolatopsis jejuensis TaxID=330084 RepID=UPI00068EB2B7|nr:MFS transporter [Amycolatopsis jejuensis]
MSEKTETGVPAVPVRGGWYRSLQGPAKPAFISSALGWGLDSFTYMIFPLALTAIVAEFGLSGAEAGWAATATLVASAIGGAGAGVIADRIGRVRTLMLAVGLYSLFTFLCGLAPNYPTLMVFRVLLGIGFGGEWAAGALLISELCNPVYRGRILGAVAAFWNVGWGTAVLLYSFLFSILPADVGWRVMFCIGIAPAALVLYIRRRVPEPSSVAKQRSEERPRSPFFDIFRPGTLRITIFAALLATGVQGGNYAIFTWLPAYLKQTRHLTAVGTGSYLAVVIVSGVIGSLVAGSVNDRLGRRPTFAIFSIGSAALILAYLAIPTGNNLVLLLIGAPLGFFSSGIFAGFGSYLAELYPVSCRGAGQGFCYNFGRAMGAFFPALIGYLSATVGLGGAMAFAAAGYLIALLSLAFLPETKGKLLTV